MDVHPTQNGIFIGIDPYPYLDLPGPHRRLQGLPHLRALLQRLQGLQIAGLRQAEAKGRPAAVAQAAAGLVRRRDVCL